MRQSQVALFAIYISERWKHLDFDYIMCVIVKKIIHDRLDG